MKRGLKFVALLLAVNIFLISLVNADTCSDSDRIINIYKIEERVDAGFSVVLNGHTYDSNKQIKIIPILLGKTESGGSKEYTCPESTGFVV